MPQFEVVITYLELTRDAFQPKPSPRADVAFSHVAPAMPELNRFMYFAVGAGWFWIDRRAWTLAEWTARVGDPAKVETWLMTVGGVPAGYVELERKGPGLVEIEYLGLMQRFIGGGLGAHLLTKAAERAFEMGAQTVLLNTCNLDHPKALSNYKARGFKPVRTDSKMKEIPSVAPGPWEGA